LENLVPADGDLRVALDYSPPPSSTAILGSAVRRYDDVCRVYQRSDRSQRFIARLAGFTLPSILYFNTLVLVASSVTLEIARRRVTTFMGGLKSQVESPARWLYVTLFLGLLFVAGQYVAWLQLRSEGLYLATNPAVLFSIC
jgi:heme/copper-type cytochrome/quinol oxidase subunit 3